MKSMVLEGAKSYFSSLCLSKKGKGYGQDSLDNTTALVSWRKVYSFGRYSMEMLMPCSGARLTIGSI